MKRKYLLIILLIIPLILTIGRSSPDKKEKKVRIGVLAAEISFPFHIAKSLGIFEKHGWSGEIIPFQSAAELNQSFQSHDIDIILNDLVTAILLKEAGHKAHALGLTRGSIPNEGRIAIVSGPDSGIYSLKDLENNSIALSLNTHAEFVLDTIADLNSVSIDKINKLRVPKIPIRLNLLLSNKIPAAVLPEPMATLALREGAFLLRDDADENFSQIVMVAHDDFIERAGDDLQDIFTIYDEAVDKINYSPEEHRKLFLKVCSIPEKLKNNYSIRKYSYIQPIPEEKFSLVYQWLQKKQLVQKEIALNDIYKQTYIDSSSS